MAVDASRPFPLIRNKTLNIAALLSKKKGKAEKEELEFATVQVPSVLRDWYISLRKMEMQNVSFYWSRSLSGILINCF